MGGSAGGGGAREEDGSSRPNRRSQVAMNSCKVSWSVARVAVGGIRGARPFPFLDGPLLMGAILDGGGRYIFYYIRNGVKNTTS